MIKRIGQSLIYMSVVNTLMPLTLQDAYDSGVSNMTVGQVGNMVI